LPREITDFERTYLARVNRIALAFFAMHVPVFTLIAWLNDTRPAVAAVLTTAVLVGPAIAYYAIKNPRLVSVVYGVTAMFMGGLLVHFGQGPVTIEMHFYFFALVAMCAVFGNPLVIVAAAVTVALHHLVLWLVMPSSVFNYEAQWWVVAVHAAFVVLESIATCFIARSFFDNVIGLERIVQARTEALDSKNRDMRLLLDNVQQGFLTMDRAGNLAQERSAAAARFFGEAAANASWFEYLHAVSPDFAARSKLAWDEVAAGIMPLELTLDQMPHRLTLNCTTHYRIDYRPIGAEPHDRFLVIVTDETSDVEREQAELERREAMAVFERVLVDRSGFEAFFEEGGNAVDALASGATTDLTTVKRLLHTLKGNSAIYGLASLSNLCHSLEDFIAEEQLCPAPSAFAALRERWQRLAADFDKLLGKRAHTIELDETQYKALEQAVKAGEPKDALLRRVRALRLEPMGKRLKHFEEQAKRIAQRLDKEVRVVIEDNDQRVDPRRWAGFWAAFIHAIRNAVDHGLEAGDARQASGKAPEGTLKLRTSEKSGRLIIEVEDDGRGVDWEAVAASATKKGLPSATSQDLQQALFTDGISTASVVTDLSGRGVGLGALLEATRSLGGDLAVQSRAGSGTTLRFTFPPSAATVLSVAPAAAQ
ncbi:MAG TPA: ATP-binding protein, partial [Polyangiaceae bacterium]|nr:ATP-binding protein [Polyangiaceae bacterium]